MKCSNINNYLLDYFENNLSNQERIEFESHIKECDNCSKKFMQFEELNNKIAKTNPIESSEFFKTEFLIELNKEKNKSTRKPILDFSLKSLLKVAASILLFTCGTIFGLIIQNKVGVNSKLTLIEQEVYNLKQQVHLTALEEKTPSEKILAIEYLNSAEINRELLAAFNSLLNNDESTNVRLEAAQALYKLSYNQNARDILLKSLNANQKPIVQIKLINYLTEIEKLRSIEPLKEIIHNGNTNKMVRDYAVTSLQTLI
jgi:plasmid stability protein